MIDRLNKVGKIEPKSSLQVKNSKLGLGFEKLDRDVFDPNKAYDKVAATGVKWIRIQSGWARTETEKGVYDFAWLDDIVDNLISRGLKPWLCLCYGNGLYDEDAKKIFGAVGMPPIYSEEAKRGWFNYVKAVVSHYKGKINDFEIWNEPDGNWCWKRNSNAEEYALLGINTAKAIREANESARIIGGAVCMGNLHFMNTAFKNGLGDYIDAVSFHRYLPDETCVFDRVTSFKALFKKYGLDLQLIQGESGCQSKVGGAGALSGGLWSERRQAKELLRQSMADILSGVEFTSYFSALDMIEALNGKVDDVASYLDYAYFGVLGADFDEKGFSTGDYSPKDSYFCLQNLASIFAEDFVVEDVPVTLHPCDSPLVFGKDCYGPMVLRGGYTRENGAYAFVYWYSSDLMTTDYESTVTIECVTAEGQQIRLIDPYNGDIYEIPENMITDNGDGDYTLNHIPIVDYPLILTVGDFYTE